MTLGERIIDLHHWDFLEPHVKECIIKQGKSGFSPRSPKEEDQFYHKHPEFKIMMMMPRLSIRIILQMVVRKKWERHGQRGVFNIVLLEYVLQALYILEGLRIWCAHRGENIPMIGTDRKELMDDWIEWGKQRGYVRD